MLLIRNKSNVNQADLLGRMPLYFAVHSNSVLLVRELLKRDASPWVRPGLKKYEEMAATLTDPDDMKTHLEILGMVSICRSADIQRQLAPSGQKQAKWKHITHYALYEKLIDEIRRF